ncbi:MAG: hypothetical protein IKW83_04185 [Muribaculaceae bacterium]|nr:hypothetical protein [Muribaculaceae bacterium]
MNVKSFIIALMMVVLVSFAALADVHHDTMSKVTHFDYSGYTYTYVDENGVEQTVSLTDEATSTDQIIALLKKVYTDPSIPGIRYAYDYKDAEGQPYQRKKLNYNANASHGTPWGKTNDIVNPYDDGMTMLVVQVKDNYKKSMLTGSDRNKIDVALQSVKLVKNFTRVNDPVNPGYIMSIDGISTNRFFFLSKGKPRATYISPFYMTYEQISPVNYATASETTNFISEIKAGHSYPCIHDCGQMLNYNPGHWFTIDQSGENYSLKNLTIFMPDRRFEENLDPDETVADDHVNGEVYKNYGRTGTDTDPFNPVIAPKVLMYTADLNAVATPSDYSTGDDRSYYDVNLDWSTSFTEEKLGLDIPQHFYVYLVNEDGSRTLIQDVEKDENGLVRVQNHTYTVEQTDETQTLRYVVTAHPINYDNDGSILTQDGEPYITISAESPVRTVTIPGLKNAFFTELSEYRSRYYVENSSKQYNIYRNTVSINPTNSTEFGKINTVDKAYRLCRKSIKNGNVSSTEKIIAQITFTPSAYNENNVVTAYNYSIIYKDKDKTNDEGVVTEEGKYTQEVREEYLFDENTPTYLETSGTITIDEPVFVLYDRFIESTISNNQDEGYVYYLKGLANTNYITRSNEYNVPVYKTENIVAGEGRTLDEVIADVDHSAKATPDNTITFKAINDPAANLVDYEIRRLRQNNFKFFTKIGKAENYNNSGQYYIYALNEAGQLNELVNIETVGTEGGNITTHDINSSNDNQTSSYVPVINTLYNGDASKPNSYGCDIQRTKYPAVKVTIEAKEKTEPFYSNDGPLMGYRVNLNISPDLPKSTESSINYVYYYRVWREIDSKNNPTLIEGEKMVNQEDNQSGEGWASDYDCLHVTYPGQNAVSVNDLFIDYAYEGNKDVKYIVRLYATTIPGQEGSGHDYNTLAVSEGGNGKDYFIAEAKITANFTPETPTGIGVINAEAKVENVTYYNMMGVGSNHPHQGVNIVVTRYTNGTTTSNKVIF